VTADPTQLGIPEDAMRRLAEMRPGQATSLFTSDLSVNEFVLTTQTVRSTALIRHERLTF